MAVSYTRSARRRSIGGALLVLATAVFCGPARGDERASQPFVGVTIREAHRDDPRPLRVWLAEIDLSADGIALLVTPGNGDPNGDQPGDPNNETTRQTTLDFLRTSGAQVAVNATFFGMGSRDTDNLGLVVSRGDRVSPFRGDWPALHLSAENRPTVLWGEEGSYTVLRPQDAPPLYNAVSGSDQIVTGGAVTVDDREFSLALHPRTAIGFGGGRLWLVTVDGRQPGVSEGVSLGELAELMIEFGCDQALNMDGGGSTTLAIADPDPRVLNTPSSVDEQGQPGVLRENGTSLAVFAKALPSNAAPHPH